MSTLRDLRNVRLEKLDAIKKLGINPYPARSARNMANGIIVSDFTGMEGKPVVVAGRVVSIRSHGRLFFIDIKDDTGKLQLYIKEDNATVPDRVFGELAVSELGLLDLGDFIEAVGKVTKTRRGEVSVEVTAVRLLAKALRPMPSAWDGLKDKETRLRRRYVDTNINDEVYARFVRRSKFWGAHREFLNKNGFLEMNIPVLEMVPGGADATPFITHMDSIDQDFYLRISQELYLKRLIGGGYPKVYEIGPRFRNEGLSDEHLPEHMAMEFYWAYADWRAGMEFVKELYAYTIDKVYGRRRFSIRGFDVDFDKEWQIIDFSQIMKERFGIDVFNVSEEEVRGALATGKQHLDYELNKQRGLDNLWKMVRKTVAGPAFLINHPKFMSPLAKAYPDNTLITERFQPIIAGSELGNGWSEINDPQDQLERFREQQRLRDAGDKEAQWLDIDYVEMLEYGMPPTFGYGHSERVFWFLEDVTAREGVPFPQLKLELDESTKEIYGL